MLAGPLAELFITTFLTALASAAMGLFVSSFFTNPDRAMTVAPILLYAADTVFRADFIIRWSYRMDFMAGCVQMEHGRLWDNCRFKSDAVKIAARRGCNSS